jgi:hypothetical protein
MSGSFFLPAAIAGRRVVIAIPWLLMIASPIPRRGRLYPNGMAVLDDRNEDWASQGVTDSGPEEEM